MEGGIGILLLLIIAVVVIVGGVALYLTGGALFFGSRDKAGADDGHRPEHKHPTSPTQEKTEYAGLHQGGEDER